ncbi:ABC transporter substrate-binding protein [Massilia sp. Root418]|uniref:substrate-binding periplasmic protein n=1 Tax=Massilia sp. Root418 TaxID=1736532 RepID=UPI0006F99A6A|nr:transporter substrate-binding domain-containing protein [Massilia sp. Root418]
MLRLLLGVVLACLAATTSAATTVTCVTEENRPVNFWDNGKVTGFSTEVVEAVLKEIDVQATFQIMPWARAYATTLHTENVLIFSIMRTAEREHLFKWVGVVSPPDSSYLFALRHRKLKLGDLDDARHYKIGTINGDAREQYLESKGFVKGLQLHGNAVPKTTYEKLKLGRIDLWAMSEMVALDIVRREGADPAQVLVRALQLTELGSGGSYMAFGPKTDDHLVERFRKGLEAVKANGTFAALQKKWF